MKKIEKLKSITASMRTFDKLADNASFIQVTEWSNEEGWDICINEKMFSISRDELEAINFLTTAVDNDVEFKNDI